jgi:hypothetical protein
VMVGSRSKGDRSDSALVGGVLLNMRRRCGLLGDVWNLAARSFPMGVLGPFALALVASMAGDAAQRGSRSKATLV